MGRLSYFFKRLVKMDWKAMWKTTGLLKERSGKSRLWLCGMLRCANQIQRGLYRLQDCADVPPQRCPAGNGDYARHLQQHCAPHERQGVLAFLR